MTKHYGYIPDNDYISKDFILFSKHSIVLQAKQEKVSDDLINLFSQKWDEKIKKSVELSVCFGSLNRRFEDMKQKISKPEYGKHFENESIKIDGKDFDLSGIWFDKFTQFKENTDKLRWYAESILRDLKETEDRIQSVRSEINSLIQFFGFNEFLNITLELWDDKPYDSISLIKGDIIAYSDGNPYKLKYGVDFNRYTDQDHWYTNGYAKHKTQNKYTEKDVRLELTKDNYKLLEKSENWKYYSVLFED